MNQPRRPSIPAPTRNHGMRLVADARHDNSTPALGRLVPPWPVNHCANVDCSHDEDTTTFNEHGAYLYRDLDTDKLVVFCGDCARHAELNAAARFKLVAL